MIDPNRIAAAERALEDEQRAAERSSRDDNARLLAFGGRLLATVRILLDDHSHKLPDTLCGVVSVSLLAKIFGTCRATYCLCKSGFARDAPTLNRSGAEALITLRFITGANCHERAERWAKFSYISQWEAAKGNPSLISGEESDTVRQRAESITGEFPNRHFWAAGLGISSLRHMAQQVGMESYYNSVYWMGSQSTHSSAVAVDDYLRVTEDRRPIFQMGLSSRYARPELAAASYALLRALACVSDTFQLEMDFGVLSSEYTEAFGVDPVLPHEGSPTGSSENLQ
jgi:uncharacterized protein DUF5677